jgi:hypothetical protein
MTVYLVQSTEPVVERVIEVTAEPVEIIAQPVEVMAQPEITVAKAAHKYATLGTIFFRGSPRGQLLSVYKTRESNPQKVADFKAALACGDCTLPAEPLSKSLKEKIVALGIAI